MPHTPTRVIVVLIVSMLLQSACGAQAEPSEPTPTAVPPTSPPTATVVPSPTVEPVDSLLPQARTLCDAAVDGPVVGGYIPTPGFALIKSPLGTGEWELLQIENGAGLTNQAPEVQSLFCVLEEPFKLSNTYYTDGSDAYRLLWDVIAVTWPDGNVLGKIDLAGGNPPETKDYAGPGYGEPPTVYLAHALSLGATGIPLLFVDSSCAALSQDRQHLVSVSSYLDDESFIKQVKTVTSLWNVETGEVLWTHGYDPDPGGICEMEISRDDSRIAISGRGRSGSGALLVNAESGELISSFDTLLFKFTPDGQTAIHDVVKNSIVSSDLQVTEIQSGKQTGKFAIADKNGFNDIVFSENGQLLGATTRNDARFVIWDVNSRSKLVEIKPGGFLDAIAFSSDNTLAAGTRQLTLTVWNVNTGEEVLALDLKDAGFPSGLVFLPDSHSLLYYGSITELVYKLDVDTSQTSTIFEHPGPVTVQIVPYPEKQLLYLIDSQGIFMQMPISP